MKKCLFAVFVLLLVSLSACGGGRAAASMVSREPPAQGVADVVPEEKASRCLVACFSATGNTEPLARFAAEYTGADLFLIEAKVPYTEDDLKYYTNCRADREQNDPSCRPEIAGAVQNMDGYDVIFLGYPIWHGQAPKILYTFLESYDFSGKTIVPFCTSASSGLGSSARNLHSSAPDAVWMDGQRFAIGTEKAAVENWIDGLHLNIKQEKMEEKKMFIYCGDRRLEVRLADNPSAAAFAEKLKSADVTITMKDYGNFEKTGSLGFQLQRTDENISTSAGDVILYLGNTIAIYYDTNNWDFTRIGRIDGMTRETMLAFFGGKGEVTVRFSLN